MRTDTFVAVALCVVPAFAIPPQSFGFPTSEDNTPLSVNFQVNGTQQRIQPGTLFGGDCKWLEPRWSHLC